MGKLFSTLKYQIYRERLCMLGQWKSEHIPAEKMEQPIDFVVTWVDGNDPEWLAEKAKYEQMIGIEGHHTDNGEERFRDWDFFQYWFRAVEKYAPWVRNVYFVTCGHVPKWMNLDAPKLKLIRHTDFIPAEYLPVFSCNPIELNLHKIEGLSEHFVYFNDDMFLNRPVQPEDFFRGGKPNFTALCVPLRSYSNSAFEHMRFNTLGMVNQHFAGEVSARIQKHPEKWFAKQYGDRMHLNLYAYDEDYLPGMIFPHLGVPVRKSTMEKVWQAFSNRLDESCHHRFRTPKDVVHQIFSMWDMMEGEFNPVGIEFHGKGFFEPEKQKQEIIDAIEQEKYRMICINDCESVSREDYLLLKDAIVEAFERTFPEKSSFEK